VNKFPSILPNSILSNSSDGYALETNPGRCQSKDEESQAQMHH
jgi:hypothetical protein